ncbi:MAG: spore coat protein [Christensenellaceae bacterium]|jgi:spore coat protein CotF|nr:spore coat protein [Christensenellaceae bacterium]
MKALNDKLMLQDILAHLRDLMMASGTAIQHSNCQNMRDVVTKTSGRTTMLQFEVFKYMNEHGMYPIKNVTDQELKEAVQMHCKA